MKASLEKEALGGPHAVVIVETRPRNEATGCRQNL
jgi:hypothetical protein